MLKCFVFYHNPSYHLIQIYIDNLPLNEKKMK